VASPLGTYRRTAVRQYGRPIYSEICRSVDKRSLRCIVRHTGTEDAILWQLIGKDRSTVVAEGVCDEHQVSTTPGAWQLSMCCDDAPIQVTEPIQPLRGGPVIQSNVYVIDTNVIQTGLVVDGFRVPYMQHGPPLQVEELDPHRSQSRGAAEQAISLVSNQPVCVLSDPTLDTSWVRIWHSDNAVGKFDVRVAEIQALAENAIAHGGSVYMRHLPSIDGSNPTRSPSGWASLRLGSIGPLQQLAAGVAISTEPHDSATSPTPFQDMWDGSENVLNAMGAIPESTTEVQQATSAIAMPLADVIDVGRNLSPTERVFKFHKWHFCWDGKTLKNGRPLYHRETKASCLIWWGDDETRWFWNGGSDGFDEYIWIEGEQEPAGVPPEALNWNQKDGRPSSAKPVFIHLNFRGKIQKIHKSGTQRPRPRHATEPFLLADGWLFEAPHIAFRQTEKSESSTQQISEAIPERFVPLVPCWRWRPTGGTTKCCSAFEAKSLRGTARP
jgi:hypothetical protein